MAKYFVEAQNIFGALHAAGFEPKAIYDVGSADGRWSLTLSRIFPKADFLLFEPLFDLKPNYQEGSGRVLRSKSNFRLFKVALSDLDWTQEMFSDEFGWGASLLPTQASKSLPEKVTVAVNRLETIVSEQKLPVPDLLKMDVQGAELAFCAVPPVCLLKSKPFRLRFGSDAIMGRRPPCFMRSANSSTNLNFHFWKFAHHTIARDAI